MEHEYNKSSNTIVYPPRSDRHDEYGGFGSNTLLGMLFFLGLVGRDGRATGTVANDTVISTLATNMHTSVESVKTMLQALQISICDQTQEITSAIHTSSTANLAGQNLLGEKVSEVKYSGAMNAKDAEKTTLIDGSLTRKNDDDNTNEIKNAQTISFAGIEKSICETNHNIATGFAKIASQNSEDTCKIIGEIKDSKYEGLLVAERNHNATMNGLKDIGFQNANIAKETIIREKDDQLRIAAETINTMQHNDIKEEIEELKRCRAKDAENNILSHNIVTNVGNSFNASFDARLSRLASSLDILSHNVNLIIANNGNNFGRNNS